MKLKYIFFLLVSFFCVSGLFSQIEGVITDNQCSPLPYATIYVENSTQGTTTNLEGKYSFNLEPGSYNLNFQYVGYKSITQSVKIDNEPEVLNIVLEEETVTLSQIVVAADAEDPAYAIIRKAIAKRDFYKNEIDSYSADLYIKGLIRTEDAPEKMMGMEIGDMSGILDSARNGVVYLSESKSILHYKKPDQYKEVMYASKVAGDIDGVSFNQFSDANFSFYDENINFGRMLLSPIADNALRYYKYKLLGTTIDKDGKQINKIEVIPKSKNDPCFYGLIYIADDSWRIHNTDMSFTGKASKVMIFDTISFKQLYVPVGDSDKYVMFSQVMDFKMGLMSFKFSGTFSYFFSNYEIDTPVKSDVFNNEIFKIEAFANEKDSLFWAAERPVPITEEERNDYHKKDSLEVLWKSEAYLDSIDRVSNKFKWHSLLFGYTHSKSYENRYVTLKSPLNTFSFNPVQGYRVAADLRYRKWNKKETSYFSAEPYVSYGFSDKKIRASIRMQKLFNSIDYSTIAIEGGRKINQLNETNPLGEPYNGFSSLMYKENFLRIFEKDFIRLVERKELFNGLMTWINVEYAHRKPLAKTTDHSWRKRDEVYSFSEFLPFNEHKSLFGSIRLRWRPGQKYMTFGEQRIFRRSKWPDFHFQYKAALSIGDNSPAALSIGDNSPDYNFIKLTMQDPYVGLGLWGYLSYNMQVGGFLSDDRVSFIDYHHIKGNPFSISGDYLNRFKTIRNYELSTKENFGVLFSEYHLNGRLMDKVPFLQNWGMKTVVGFNTAQIGDRNIMETSIGLESIGIGGISIFRLDYAWSFNSEEIINHGIFLSLTEEIN